MHINIYPGVYCICLQVIFNKHILLDMRYINSKMNYLLFVSCYLCHICHISNDNLCGQKSTLYDIIVTFILFYEHYMKNSKICGTKQILFELILNAVKCVSFCCHARYINRCDCVCNIPVSVAVERRRH